MDVDAAQNPIIVVVLPMQVLFEMDAFNRLSSPLGCRNLQEISSLKKKLEGAGPEVVEKLAEEKETLESRLRMVNGKVKDLEHTAERLKQQIAQSEEDRVKVNTRCDWRDRGMFTITLQQAKWGIISSRGESPVYPTSFALPVVSLMLHSWFAFIA